MSSPLPAPSEAALTHCRAVRDLLVATIREAGGFLDFARFMELALYAPGLGYYTAGARKFGSAGDFVTAPELSPLFAQALATPIAEVMAQSAPCILEAGAGSGRLAADLLLALEARGQLPEHYLILDLSADLRQRQRETLAAAVPHLLPRVTWLDRLPERFSGLVLGNELLDAMPVHLLQWQADDILEKGVGLEADGEDWRFVWRYRPASGALRTAAAKLATEMGLPAGFESELNLAGPAWAAEWGERLDQGAVLLLDYGFPRHEYYLPQRHGGTLMCHYRHHAHPDPLLFPGLQDITAHVDFTAVIATAFPRGLALLGYTSQGQFLLNCGILDQLAQRPNPGLDYMKGAQAVNKLVLPQEMGELFKVIALGKGLEAPLTGFQRGDRSHAL
ncbi:MAG: hypothetical protein RIR00_1671 [Pseudomonadota bacterium]|jgi:SAM-dependent MidA family methyltransferase